MNADDAFNRLMRESKLAIPAARPGAVLPSPRRRPAVDTETPFPPETAPDPVPVAAALADHPTETGLSPAGDDIEAVEPEDEYNLSLEEAEKIGAHIVGRDAGENPHVPSPPEAAAEPGPERLSTSRRVVSPLGKARRVRRFAHLPLADNDVFDNAARELAVGLAEADPGRPSLLVTSAERGEGRTEMAIRLALAMARRVGWKVLLADFDVKNPWIAPRLGLTVNYFGLVEVLRGACPLEEALTVGDEDNLYVLPARPPDRAGDEIVESRQAAALLADIHAAFDFAVIDAGPVEHGEVRTLSRHVGGVAVTGFGRRTTAGRLERAAERVESAYGGRVAGMLLAGV